MCDIADKLLGFSDAVWDVVLLWLLGASST